MSTLGYIFIFYVGYYYFRLAENYKRNKWVFGFLGIFFYYFGIVLYVLYQKIFVIEEIDEFDLTSLSLKSFVAGFIIVFFMFHWLNYIWSRNDKKKVK